MEQLLERLSSQRCNPEMPAAPVNINGFTYATNGHIMLRVPIIEKYNATTTPTEKTIGLFTSIGIDNDNRKWEDIPKYETPNKIDCHFCGGHGQVDTCEECDGDGNIDYYSGFNSYEWECKTCYSEGVVPGNDKLCTRCYGEKKVYRDRFAHIDALDGNGARISTIILDTLKDLPGIKITLEVEEKSVLFLKFNNGRGCFMPMTK